MLFVYKLHWMEALFLHRDPGGIFHTSPQIPCCWRTRGYENCPPWKLTFRPDKWQFPIGIPFFQLGSIFKVQTVSFREGICIFRGGILNNANLSKSMVILQDLPWIVSLGFLFFPVFLFDFLDIQVMFASRMGGRFGNTSQILTSRLEAMSTPY